MNNLVTITKKTQMYKTLSKNGYMDFPSINARVLYYSDGKNEYAVTVNLNNCNSIDIEIFKEDEWT